MSCCDCNTETPKPKILAVILDLDGTLLDTGLEFTISIAFDVVGHSHFYVFLVLQSGLQGASSRSSWPSMARLWIRRGKRRGRLARHSKTRPPQLSRTMIFHWLLTSSLKKSSPCINKSKSSFLFIYVTHKCIHVCYYCRLSLLGTLKIILHQSCCILWAVVTKCC